MTSSISDRLTGKTTPKSTGRQEAHLSRKNLTSAVSSGRSWRGPSPARTVTRAIRQLQRFVRPIFDSFKNDLIVPQQVAVIERGRGTTSAPPAPEPNYDAYPTSSADNIRSVGGNATPAA